MLLKDVKLEAIDQSVSMLMKKEPCDPVVSSASVESPVGMHHQAGSYEKNTSAFVPTREPKVVAVSSGTDSSTFVPTRKEPKVVVNGSSAFVPIRREPKVVVANTNSSSGSGSTVVPQYDPRRDPRNRPRAIVQATSLASDSVGSLASNPSNVAVNKSPVVVQQAVQRPVAVVTQAEQTRPVAVVTQAEQTRPGIINQAANKKIATTSGLLHHSSSHVESTSGWASSVGNNMTKSPVVVNSKQADVVFGRVSLKAAANSTMHHDEQRPVKIENTNNDQATLDSSYSLCGDKTSGTTNTSSSVSRTSVPDGDCSAKPIVLSEATTVKKSNNKIILSPAAYRASKRERFSSEKVYTTSIPPYDPPSTSPRQQAAALAAAAPSTTVSAPAAPSNTTTVSTTTAAAPSSVKRAAETSVDDLRRQEQQALASSDDENLIAMENMLSELKGKLVTLTLDLCISNSQKLSDAFATTNTQITYLKRTIASLKKDTPVGSVFDENYKKTILMNRLVPWFQWEGNVTNARERVFNTIYACLRQVDRAAQDTEFDMERKWRSVITPKLSSAMHHWVDGLLVRKPRLTWSQFKLDLCQEYEFHQAKALKELTLAHYNADTESMNSFVNRFLRNLEYSKVSEKLAATYFYAALPTLDERSKFKLLYETSKKNHPQDDKNAFRAIDLFRDIHNQACECNDAYKNPPLPAPQPQPYELHQRMSPQPQPQQQQERSVSPKVEDLQPPQQQQPKFKKQKFNPKKPQLHCLFHPKARSHLTINCRNNPLSTNFVHV